MQTDKVANFQINSGYNTVQPDFLKFIDLMNTHAKEMGLSSSHFMNPHGLNNVDNYSTCEDLLKLSLEAMKNPKFRDVVKTIEYTGNYMRKKINLKTKYYSQSHLTRALGENQIAFHRKEFLKSIDEERSGKKKGRLNSQKGKERRTQRAFIRGYLRI